MVILIEVFSGNEGGEEEGSAGGLVGENTTFCADQQNISVLIEFQTIYGHVSIAPPV